MMNKKVALFIGTIVSEYLAKSAAGLSSAALGMFDLDVFSNIGGNGVRYFYKEGEETVVDIPNLADYDGIFVCPDSLSQEGLYEILTRKIETEAHCPVIALRCRDPRFYSILIDDISAMKEVVEHMIDVHGKKHICFMTGRLELEDARERLASYRAVMAERGLKVTEHMVFEGDYWKLKGEEAVSWFLEDDEMPEAIVCANDYMAISVVTELQKRGIKVPEEIAVTGFDNIDDSKLFEPRIASMDMSVRNMCEAGAEVMRRLLNNEEAPKDTYVSVSKCFEGSCGCPTSPRQDLYRKLFSENLYLDNTVVQATYMNNDFDTCLNVDELLANAFRYSYNFPYNEVYYCQSEYRDDTDLEMSDPDYYSKYTDKMILKSIFKHDEGVCRKCNEVFERTKILPDKYRDGSTLFTVAVRSRTRSHGYFVIKTDHSEKLGRFFLVWLQSFATGLDRIHTFERNKEFMKFKSESIHDPLTGLFNRREMESHLNMQRNSPESFYIMELDLDGLKYINDTFGHTEGDKILCAFADILRAVSDEKVAVARIGGDEFTACVVADSDDGPEKLKKTICEMIAQYNSTHDNPYELSTSIGYARFKRGDGILKCINEADKKMYLEKNAKKHARK